MSSNSCGYLFLSKICNASINACIVFTSFISLIKLSLLIKLNRSALIGKISFCSSSNNLNKIRILSRLSNKSPNSSSTTSSYSALVSFLYTWFNKYIVLSSLVPLELFAIVFILSNAAIIDSLTVSVIVSCDKHAILLQNKLAIFCSNPVISLALHL